MCFLAVAFNIVSLSDVKRGETSVFRRLHLTASWVACVASVSTRVRREKMGREQKKGMTGEGEGKEGNACPQTPRF